LAKIITVANQKGGVGKTTSAVNLAAGLGYYSKRTLLVDIDPQGNATSGVGFDKRSIEKSTYDILLAQAKAEEVILHTK
jgi:chromosome partitioning protein